MGDAGTDKRLGFFMIENSVIDDLNLSPHTGWLYCTIVRHVNQQTNVAFPSIATLARKSGMGNSTVIKHLKILAGVNLITITQRKNKQGGWASNHYSLIPAVAALPVKMNGGSPPDGQGVVHQMDKGSPPDGQGVVHQVDTNKTKGKKTKEQNFYQSSSSAPAQQQQAVSPDSQDDDDDDGLNKASSKMLRYEELKEFFGGKSLILEMAKNHEYDRLCHAMDWVLLFADDLNIRFPARYATQMIVSGDPLPPLPDQQKEDEPRDLLGKYASWFEDD